MLAYPSSYFEVRQGGGQYVGLFCAYKKSNIALNGIAQYLDRLQEKTFKNLPGKGRF
jgi:hypothetical protein